MIDYSLDIDTGIATTIKAHIGTENHGAGFGVRFEIHSTDRYGIPLPELHIIPLYSFVLSETQRTGTASLNHLL